MTIDIERLKHDLDYWLEVAPEGATHYIIDDDDDLGFLPAFYRDEGGRWRECGGEGYWCKSDVNPPILIPRPSPEWDGSGLPPVGVECEGDTEARPGDYEPCIPIYHDTTAGELQHTTVALFKNSAGNFTNPEWCTKFRPIKTEKERVVIAALGVAKEPEDDEIHPRQYLLDSLNALYDAGALKEPTND